MDSDGVKIYFHHIISAPSPENNATKQLWLKVCERIINEINNGRGAKKGSEDQPCYFEANVMKNNLLGLLSEVDEKTMTKCEKSDNRHVMQTIMISIQCQSYCVPSCCSLQPVELTPKLASIKPPLGF